MLADYGGVEIAEALDQLLGARDPAAAEAHRLADAVGGRDQAIPFGIFNSHALDILARAASEAAESGDSGRADRISEAWQDSRIAILDTENLQSRPQTTRAEHDSPSQRHVSNVIPFSSRDGIRRRCALSPRDHFHMHCKRLHPWHVTNSTSPLAISYPNGKPHIGHAYEVIATDALARFQRLDGKDVFFLTGTDEHGLKMLQTAEQEGITPRELADRNSAELPARWPRRSAAPTTTSSAPPSRATTRPCQAIWKAMAGQWRHLPATATPAGTRSATRPITTRRRPTLGEDGVRYGAAGHAGRMGRGGELFLPPLRLSGPAARALRGATRTSSGRRSAATRSSASSSPG